MDRELFVLVVKQAHMLTRQYLKRFAQYSYKAQYGIFFRLVHEVYKQKMNKAETSVKAETSLLKAIKNKVTDLQYKVKNIFAKKVKEV